jgi:hypothetical protein
LTISTPLQALPEIGQQRLVAGLHQMQISEAQAVELGHEPPIELRSLRSLVEAAKRATG